MILQLYLNNFTQFKSFKQFSDGIFQFNSNLHVQGLILCGKLDKFGGI